MENASPTPLRLDEGHNQNWKVDARPVAILNEDSTLHERIAYCWGLAESLNELTVLLNESAASDVARVSGLYYNRLQPLVAMLERLGSDTRIQDGDIGGAA